MTEMDEAALAEASALVDAMENDEFEALTSALMRCPEGRMVTEVAANILEHAADSAEKTVLRGGMPLEDWLAKVREGAARLHALAVTA